jgi:putative membrane protein insertion efficiency factor
MDRGDRPALMRLRAIRSTAPMCISVFILALWWTLGFPLCACGSETRMKGPHAAPLRLTSSQEVETSSVRIAFLQSIRFYQKWVSPIRAEQCGFSPSCSRYGHAAIVEHGPVFGVIMTADRLTRCNIWKKPGPDYILLPNGKLYDPVSNNLLFEK